MEDISFMTFLMCFLVMGFIVACVQLLIYLEKKYPCKESEKHYGSWGCTDDKTYFDDRDSSPFYD